MKGLIKPTGRSAALEVSGRAADPRLVRGDRQRTVFGGERKKLSIRSRRQQQRSSGLVALRCLRNGRSEMRLGKKVAEDAARIPRRHVQKISNLLLRFDSTEGANSSSSQACAAVRQSVDEFEIYLMDVRCDHTNVRVDPAARQGPPGSGLGGP